jgi:hypothetical protein
MLKLGALAIASHNSICVAGPGQVRYDARAAHRSLQRLRWQCHSEVLSLVGVPRLDKQEVY